MRDLKSKRNSTLNLDLSKLFESTIGELLNMNYKLLHYRILANVDRLRVEERRLRMEIEEISMEHERPYNEDCIRRVKKRLEDIQRGLENFEKISDKIRILDTISIIKGEHKDENKELWDNIEQIKFKNVLNFEGNPEDKIAVYNHLIRVIRGLPPESIFEKPSKRPFVEDRPSISKTVSVSEKDYINMNVEEWIKILDECFNEGKQIELPDNYLVENLRRPLRNLIVGMLELSPEKLRRIFPRKYKYLLLIHNILHTILKENGKYEVTPSSSDKEYVEGEGGIFNIFQTEIENEETTDNIRRKIYKIKIAEREYKIVREILLDNGKAKLITYALIKRKK